MDSQRAIVSNPASNVVETIPVNESNPSSEEDAPWQEIAPVKDSEEKKREEKQSPEPSDWPVVMQDQPLLSQPLEPPDWPVLTEDQPLSPQTLEQPDWPGNCPTPNLDEWPIDPNKTFDVDMDPADEDNGYQFNSNGSSQDVDQWSGWTTVEMGGEKKGVRM
ncbi:hypothetical protein DM01DRAFT_1187198 [Hesseltinella vesiculosa]|uniref:Uncharacterized protein n=1 Tax=Hesseltinella vesiculosa TaxID=101127 RepID=A0A1X2GQY5_9FUNG|nr:hypothetical protein DM01DRAFT_1187198 [Hesseltinella vesiculosa]